MAIPVLNDFVSSASHPGLIVDFDENDIFCRQGPAQYEVCILRLQIDQFEELNIGQEQRQKHAAQRDSGTDGKSFPVTLHCLSV